MRRKLDLEIGEGLFTSDPVPVEVEFADHVATFYMTALTQDAIAELAKDGVKLDEVSLKKMNESQQAAQAKKLLAKFVHGWEGLKAGNIDIPFNEANRDRIAVTEVLASLVGIAKDLGVTRQEAEEKN
jgi:hypothetical protein